jgi:predicted transcriptional regulator
MTVDRNKYMKRWRHDTESGRPRTVPAAPIAAHIRTLLDPGVSVRRVAELAGISETCVRQILNGQRTTGVRTATALQALTVSRVRAHPKVRVSALGAQRRIQALFTLGWRVKDINAAAGQDIEHVLHRDTILRETHDAVCRAYDTLSMRHGPSTATRNRAHKSGYAPPLAWDDDKLDDPRARSARRRSQVDGRQRISEPVRRAAS